MGRILGIALLLAFASQAFPFAGENRGFLNPMTHRSMSGVFSLFVDPADPMGNESASYIFSQNGVPLWTNRHDFALREVVVADTCSDSAIRPASEATAGKSVSWWPCSRPTASRC
ncbi:MAG: hypothetical protein ACPGVU_02435 [Limisphaerales bacterium]